MKHLSIGVFLSLLLLTACSKESTGDAMIKIAELTKFEESLVDLTTDHSFIFDLEINNDEIAEIMGTVDYYENGEFVRTVSGITTAISEEENKEDKLTVAIIHQARNDKEEQWITSSMTEDGQSSGTVLNNIDGKAREKFASVWGGVNEGPLTIGQKKVIGVLAYSAKDGLSMANSIETKEDIKRATNYEQVYLLSVELR
ncbi:hypothetical protein [Paenisporosarcina sp.]|uniref:hypothetical protein n=1 Tax=Paenisporosarcina sp. TaxID=1932001 RepID=UPI003C76BBAA